MLKFIEEIKDEEIGGKARGLKILKDLGLNVPDACVLIHPRKELLDEFQLKKSISLLGEGRKAVRSSAVSEDGEIASFAGQFESFLNLETFPDIKDAIHKCLDAAQGSRVRNYVQNLNDGADLRISVILQNMVHAKVAGVVFSANPVSNRRDKIIINAVEGAGEQLVSGWKDAHHYEIYKSGSNVQQQTKKHGNLLSEEKIREILEGTLKAERQFGKPVDLEWVIDEKETLHWLQVRPITTLQEIHFNELDTLTEPVDQVWTLGNIGEMMPGVVTPLTYSVSFYAVDYGMAIFADAAGARKLKRYKPYRYIQMFYNRLFFNMSNMLDFSNNVWLNKPENIQMSICGRVIPGQQVSFESPLPVRIFNFGKQMISLSWTKKSVRRLHELADQYSIDLSGGIPEVYQEVADARDLLTKAFGYHLLSSGQSGSLYAAIIGILTGNKRNADAGDHHIATVFLSEIKNIESADVVKALDHFAFQININPELASKFSEAEPEEALSLLKTSSDEFLRIGFETILQRHGHRCIRESELREKTWGDDPRLLIRLLQTSVRAHHQIRSVRMKKSHSPLILKNVTPLRRLFLKLLLNPTRAAVSRREETKSASIKFLNKIRQGYRHLALMLVRENLLDDPDQVFFLTHEELGELIRDRHPKWKKKAESRRIILPETAKLNFHEICYGLPVPIEEEKVVNITSKQVQGIPVSRGIIEGRVRIVHSVEDAQEVKPGEIMVTSYTDIGWTPYFSIISGLITEIGSPLSHGAVVAREYGIPAIVGAKGAKTFLKTGDMIRLDGDTGIAELISYLKTDPEVFYNQPVAPLLQNQKPKSIF